MKRIRIAQIGTSKMSHGSDIFRTLCALDDVFEVVGYAMPEDEEQRFPKRMKAFLPYRKMTVEEILSDPDIDAVAVETEEVYLTKYAQMVAESGKHLHMEKPGGTDPIAFDRLIDTIEERGIVFSTGYMYRHNSAIQNLLEKIQAGELGDILYVQAQMNCLHEAENRQWLENFPGGMMFFLGCHLVDLIYRIQGEPKNVIALNRPTRTDGVTSCDFGMAVFEYERGVSFAQTTAVERGGFLRRQLVVVGTKASAVIHPLEEYVEGTNNLFARTKWCADSGWHTPSKEETSSPRDRYMDMMLAFARAVNKEQPLLYTPEYERKLYHLVLRACGINM